ncbi:MAG: DnaJ C-terminal domain-containing protein [Pseudomonadota bacterium]
MYDVFLSYKSERRRAVRHLAKVLELYGYSVWYDHKLVAGADFARQIDDVLQKSKVVMPLWCTLSVNSDWVLEEAHVAKEHGVILPVMIEQIRLPFGFTRLDTVDLSNWDASPRSHSIDRLIDEVARMVNKPPAINYSGLRTYEESWRDFGAPSLAQFALSDPQQDATDAPRGQAPSDPPPNPKASRSALHTGDETAAAPDAAPDVFGDVFGDFFKNTDLINETFGNRSGKKPPINPPERGTDMECDLSLSLEQAFHGDTVDMTIPIPRLCDRCGGTGRHDGQTCPVCNGHRLIDEDRSLSIKVPAGVYDGMQLRLAGQGAPGITSDGRVLAEGDLYVIIAVTPHPRFAVENADLMIVEKIQKHVARKGGRHRLQHISGEVLEIQIPQDSRRGQKLRLRGRGMPTVQSKNGQRGDLYIELDY